MGRIKTWLCCRYHVLQSFVLYVNFALEYPVGKFSWSFSKHSDFFLFSVSVYTLDFRSSNSNILLFSFNSMKIEMQSYGCFDVLLSLVDHHISQIRQFREVLITTRFAMSVSNIAEYKFNDSGRRDGEFFVVKRRIKA